MVRPPDMVRKIDAVHARHDHIREHDNESDVLRIGSLEIENRVDRISLTGDVVLTRDRAGLALAKELQALLAQVVRTLEANKSLPEAVEVLAAKTVKNPFA